MCYTADMKPTMRAILTTAILADGLTLPQLAAASGTDRVQLWRFVTGRRDVTLGTVDLLLAALGMRVQLVRQRKTKGR